jgi:hypothetical protein
MMAARNARLEIRWRTRTSDLLQKPSLFVFRSTCSFKPNRVPMRRSKQLRYDTNSLAILFFASHSFALHRSIACVIFFGVSPPLQLTISCAGILCSTFADTTSDRSALRTQGLALSGLPMRAARI